MIVKTFIACLVLLVSTTHVCQAQDTLALYGEYEGELSRFIYTDTTPFDVVALATTSRTQNAIEFVMTEIQLLYPGVFKIGTVRANNTPLDLGNNAVGEYIIAYGACLTEPLGPGPVEAVRVTYFDVVGEISDADVVLSVRGFQPGDSRPSSCDGVPCYASCDDRLYDLSLEPWSEFGRPVNPDLAGAMVLNPTLLPVRQRVGSVGGLKTRY